MENINDPKNIIGMGDILADDDEDINIEKIEESITKGIDFMKKEDTLVDLSKEYNDELERLTRQYDIKTDQGNEPSLDAGNTEDDDNLLNWSPDTSYSPPIKHKESVPSKSYSLEEDDSDNESVYRHRSWSSSKPRDHQLYSMTNEEKKQSHINKVLGNLDDVKDDKKFIQEEEEEDEMARIFEQIDLLKSNLEAEGVNLDRIPDVDTNTSRKEARGVLKILQIKNDRLRYCDMFEEGILAVAYGLESVFDGNKEWFGAKIDLVGWPETVKVKLRRMRYDTSSFVSDVMKGYNIGHGWRIIFELLPSLFLYSRDRRLRTNDNLISDSAYKNALNDLQ